MARYIDAEALTGRLRRINNDIFPLTPKGILEVIKEQPTADVQEVKHGRYYLNTLDAEWTCSVCGRSEYINSIPHFNFCPYCGARMDMPKFLTKEFNISKGEKENGET